MRRTRLLIVGIALSLGALFAPAPAHAFRCANLPPVGDPCAAACKALGPLASKVVLCRLT